MGDTDAIPVRDTNHVGGIEQRAAQQRRMVGKWERDELEDKYLRMYEENIILKKHARKQEDKIKRMATKLLRLVNDKKKTVDPDHGGVKRVRDIETEEKLEELQDKNRDLEKFNAQLKEKLMLAKQQLMATSKRPTAYSHVSARISTGIPKSPADPRLTKNIRVMGPAETGRRAPHSPTMQRYGHSVLEETRAENKKLEDYLNQQQEQINMYEQEIATLKEQIRLRESEYEEDLAKIKHQINAEQRVNVQENIDMIKLQREVKEKSTRLLTLQEKYSLLEENLRTVKRSHDNMLMEMENLNLQLKEEQNRSLTLQNELKQGSANQRKVLEMQEQISDLKKETHILKEANEKLVSSAFDLEREREWRQKENALKVQIAQLEATLKSDLGEKGGILDKLAVERDQFDKLQNDYRELQLNHFQVKENYDDLLEKMKFFTKESAIDFTEIEEALVLVKQKKQRTMKQPDFLHRVDEELGKDAERRLHEIQAEYAETVHELEKTRNMLVVQHKINKDYQQEVVLATNKLDETKKEYELKLDEYARLLDIRAARIKKLEAQLRDVAYGTKQYRIPPPTEDMDEGTVEFDETIHLERGQNLFEIHVQKVNLSAEALKQLGDEEPSIFCTWEFFEYEIQSTPVLRGARPEFDFTSQYVVKVDDFFLHYIQKESCTLELHQSFGQDYQTIAACQMVFKEIFDKPGGRIHGTGTLTGVIKDGTGLGFGTVEYWIRLRVPMDQALRLYKERTKALGYLTTNMRATDQALQALDETAAKRPTDNVNELHIKVIRCQGIKPRREGVQPSPYCVYQFFDYNDHDTVIIHSSNNPEFNDHKTYPVPMTAELHQYLTTGAFKIFVFDDTDPEQTAYLGIADIPLIPLAHDKGVQGIFELRGPNSKINGTIEVEMRWQFSYIPPKGVTRTAEQREAAPDEPPVKLVTMPGEDLSQPADSQTRPRMAAKFPEPSYTSTPMPKQRDVIEPRVSMPAASMQSKGDSQVRRRLVGDRSEVQEESGTSIAADSRTDSMVHDAVSRAISDIIPSGSETMTTINETAREEGSSETPRTPPPTVPGEAPPGPDYMESDDEVTEEIQEEVMESDRTTSRTDTGRGDTKRPTPTTPMGETLPAQDTMFEETPRRDSEAEEVSEDVISPEQSERDTLKSMTYPKIETEGEEEESPPMIESDSEGLVMARKPTKKKQRMAAAKVGNSVTIAITHLSLEEDSAPMKNDAIRQLFVEYRFLGINPQETETPFSLPKPKPYHQIQFNFTKTFQVDFEKNYQRRQYLASMLLPNDPDNGRIRFTVVSEPPEDDQDADCEDVGSAFVSVKDILLKQKDVVEQDVDIVDITDEKTVIGTMNLTVQCLAALQSVEKEMQVEGTY